LGERDGGPSATAPSRRVDVIACTIVARNFLPFARVLAESFRAHHADVPFAVLVVDGETGSTVTASEWFEVLTPNDLGIDRLELHQLAAMYGPRELSTALKPKLLSLLLAQHEAVLYLDPDMHVYASMHRMWELATSHSIVLTPHVLEPVPRDARSPTDVELALTGIFNLGFVAVGRGARPFLDWWWERLRRDCVFERRNGLFVDQKWVDWVPALFDHFVVKQPELNVAHWNVHERNVAITESGYTVDGRPLCLFHFSGYRPDRPDLLTTYTYRLPLRVSELTSFPVLRRLCDAYGSDLRANDYDGYRDVPYGYARAADGTVIDDVTRTRYRSALIASDGGGAPPPNPFDPHAGDEFAEWRRAARGFTFARMRGRLAALRSTRPR
jgi:hypothetical protein